MFYIVSGFFYLLGGRWDVYFLEKGKDEGMLVLMRIKEFIGDRELNNSFFLDVEILVFIFVRFRYVVS